MKSLSGKEFARLIERYGWTLARINGSHHIYIKEGRIERVSIPIHGNESLKTGLQKHLMKIIGLTDYDL